MSKPKPELKQFGDLCPADFERYPVWIACHTEDFAEPWFNETDEETFRPWSGALPVAPSDGKLPCVQGLSCTTGAITMAS
jgi:hypothetical protein